MNITNVFHNDDMTPARRWANQPLNYGLMAVSSVLSIFGCLLIILSYVAYKDIRTKSRHIIVCISIADFIVASANFSGLFVNPKPVSQVDMFCILESFIGTTAVLWSFLWTMMLAVFLYVTIVRGNVLLAENMVYPYFHLICWIIPLVINTCALCLKVLGNTGDTATSGWCWINLIADLPREKMIMWMMLDGKGIEILTYIVVSVIYIRIKFFLNKKIRYLERSNSNSSSSITTQVTVKAAKSTDRKLILVPILLVLLRIWGTIRFFLFVFHWKGKHELCVFEKILINLQAIGDNFQGAINCILFCFLTPKVWNHIRDSFHNYCACVCCSTRVPRVLLTEEDPNNMYPEHPPPHPLYHAPQFEGQQEAA